ncbi:hypothetical protein SK128_011036 [Halocaridina rubra]|uniref:Uncharacterized protein n=1 Tax=Halocaridina rubra TaxID=373956 RepID=A0AAN8WU92_HALRR
MKTRKLHFQDFQRDPSIFFRESVFSKDCSVLAMPWYFFKPELAPPSGNSLETIRSLLTRMQRVYAPREKLEYLLATISHIYQAEWNSDASQRPPVYGIWYNPFGQLKLRKVGFFVYTECLPPQELISVLSSCSYSMVSCA